jgi:hypothetical protein
MGSGYWFSCSPVAGHQPDDQYDNYDEVELAGHEKEVI